MRAAGLRSCFRPGVSFFFLGSEDRRTTDRVPSFVAAAGTAAYRDVIDDRPSPVSGYSAAGGGRGTPRLELAVRHGVERRSDGDAHQQRTRGGPRPRLMDHGLRCSDLAATSRVCARCPNSNPNEPLVPTASRNSLAEDITAARWGGTPPSTSSSSSLCVRAAGPWAALSSMLPAVIDVRGDPSSPDTDAGPTKPA